ncbi:MAG: hypothetical protein WC152_05110 [Candidatus Izemoplasmatales bacterium]
MFKQIDFEQSKLKDIRINSDYPMNKLRCFSGAWYHKVVTSRKKWLGIETVITLPEFIPDETRKENTILAGEEIMRFLDTPSVYLGSSSDYENDIGFGFFHGKIDGELTKEKITFRPFWRNIYIENGKEVNTYRGSNIDDTEYYFFPGDKVKVSLICLKEEYLTFKISLLQQTNIEPYASIRKKLQLPKDFCVENILAPGNGIRDTEYKIVNAIDQYHNEGKPTQMTRARAINCIFHNSYLFIEKEKELLKVPFFKQENQVLCCPDERGFLIKEDDEAKVVSIIPEKSVNL